MGVKKRLRTIDWQLQQNKLELEKAMLEESKSKVENKDEAKVAEVQNDRG